MRAQAPDWQAPVAWSSVAQLVPQAPQFAVSFCPSTSQPSAGLMLQCKKPAWQVLPQAPLTQVAVVFGPAPQALAQAPQFFASESVFVSHPLATSASQSAVPAGHATSLHAPDTQATVPLAAMGQALPQAPQFVRSALTSMHAALQQARATPASVAVQSVAMAQAAVQA
jgi:hypothetical protein